jgi:hypothetical protein
VPTHPWRALSQLLSKLLSPGGHTDRLPNLLAEQLFSMDNETLIKAEGSFNFRAMRDHRRSRFECSQIFPGQRFICMI